MFSKIPTAPNHEKPQRLTRELPISLRSVEGNERRFEISFSSEEPYMRWFGREILDHSEGAVNLKRLNEIGCVLFNHNRDKVVGKIISASLESGRGKAVIEFDSDEDSETVFQKTKGGTLKGVSVGYIVNRYEHIKPGKKSADGRFEGECFVAVDWEPYEVSIVSVPADPTVGVGRDMERSQSDSELDIFKAQLQINQNYIFGGLT